MGGLPSDGRLNNEFLYYWLLSQREVFEKVANGSTIKTIGLGYFRRLKLALPSISEQRRIAEILRTWDEAIETTEQLIAAKEVSLRGEAYQLLFGGRRFNARKSASFQDYRWYRFPSDWECVQIGDVAHQAGETNVGGAAVTVLSCTKHGGLVESLSYFGRQIFSEDTSNYKVVRRGQFAYATNHLEEGSIGYLDFLNVGLVSPIYTAFQTDRSRVHDPYLLKVFKTATFLHIFQANTSASVYRRGGLRWDDFAKIRVPLPSVDEQLEISDFIDTGRQEITLLKHQRDALAKQKRGLMQKLLTGEWPVSVPKSQEAAE